MKVVHSRLELRDYLAEKRQQGKSVGLVPTMGALHSGHARLLRRSVEHNDETVLTLFVNPKQFGANEDLSTYPRTLKADLQVARDVGVSCVFAPDIVEVYPRGFATTVSVSPQYTKVLCGQYRDGHFDGVTTVVLLLLNLVMADRAYFGLKDFQQYAIIRRMVTDITHPTEIVGVPTVRESDGLALSSRNRFLSTESRASAVHLSRALARAAKLFLSGERDAGRLLQETKAYLAQSEIVPQYVEICHSSTLDRLDTVVAEEGAVLALAALYPSTAGGVCRLIDNVLLKESHNEKKVLEAITKLL